VESVSLGGWVSAPPPAPPPPSLGTAAPFATRPHKLKLNQLWPASRGVQGGGSRAGAGGKGQGVCGPFWEGRLQLTLKAVNVTRGLLCCARAAWVSCVLCCVLCAVCCVLCAVCCVLCAVCCVLCAVCCVLCVVAVALTPNSRPSPYPPPPTHTVVSCVPQTPHTPPNAWFTGASFSVGLPTNRTATPLASWTASSAISASVLQVTLAWAAVTVTVQEAAGLVLVMVMVMVMAMTAMTIGEAIRSIHPSSIVSSPALFCLNCHVCPISLASRSLTR